MYKYPEQTNKCIAMLAKAGISQTIIDECFIPDETETHDEIAGSVLMAVEMSTLDHEIAEKIINEVFPEISPYTITIEKKDFVALVKDSGLPIDADPEFVKELAEIEKELQAEQTI